MGSKSEEKSGTKEKQEKLKITKKVMKDLESTKASAIKGGLSRKCWV